MSDDDDSGEQSLLISSVKEPKKLGTRLYNFLESLNSEYDLIRIKPNLYRLKIDNPSEIKKNLRSNINTCDLRVILD